MSLLKQKCMGKIKDITGKRYGRLTVISRDPNKQCFWICLCDCGNFHSSLSTRLNNGNCRSCGCLQRETMESFWEKCTTHGEGSVKTRTKEYTAWAQIKSRCTNTKNKAYYRYGGCGITMCDEWLNSYETFLDDMGRAPSPKHTIDRKNNNLGYSKDNCRWATYSEQNRNKNITRLMSINGVTMPLIDWCEASGMPYSTVMYRVNNGWSDHEAIHTPIRVFKTGPYCTAEIKR